jgi:hypothetical protein
VPWAITVLLSGFLLAVGFVICAANGLTSGATILFALALICIVVGVIGLYQFSRKQAAAPPEVQDTPTRASVYRQYPVRIDATLLDQWTKTSLQLKEQLEARDWQVDWTDYRLHADAAHRAAAEGDLLTAFRHHCRALALLAAPFNQHRPKEEVFRPKWESPGH